MSQAVVQILAVLATVVLAYQQSRVANWVDELNLLGHSMATWQTIRGRDGSLMPGKRIAGMMVLTRTAGRREWTWAPLVPIAFGLAWYAFAWYWSVALVLASLMVGRGLRNRTSPPVHDWYYVDTLIAELPAAAARAQRARQPRDSEALLQAREWLLALRRSRVDKSTWADE